MAKHLHGVGEGSTLRGDNQGDKSSWSRSSSFSLCSNDSCTSSDQHSTYSDASHTHLPVKTRSVLQKRNRNSSGSSMSSSVSGISDKDAKKRSVSPPPETPMSLDDSINGEGLASLISPTHGFELQHETLLKERLSYQSSATPIAPVRRNLRQSIRKTKCSCCTSTSYRTEIVFRHYKEVGKATAGKKETVISSTKVKINVQNATQVTFGQQACSSASKIDQNRKRKSELQKLYESLHEMGSPWAKNMSPDNILKPLDVRQAASSSVFGRSPDKGSSPAKRHSKRLKSNGPERSPTNKQVSPQNRVRTRSRSLRNALNDKTSSPHKSSFFTKSNNIHSDVSPSRVREFRNASNRLDSRTLMGNISNSDSSPLRERSPSVEPDALIPASAPLSPCISEAKSDCSSAADDDASERLEDFSIPTTFYDMAEDGLEGCFQEVAAEVVITTCVDSSFDLPLLTPIQDTCIRLKKCNIKDSPPILEPCIEFNVDEHIKPKDPLSILAPLAKNHAMDEDSSSSSESDEHRPAELISSLSECNNKVSIQSDNNTVPLSNSYLDIKRKHRIPEKRLFLQPVSPKKMESREPLGETNVICALELKSENESISLSKSSIEASNDVLVTSNYTSASNSITIKSHDVSCESSCNKLVQSAPTSTCIVKSYDKSLFRSCEQNARHARLDQSGREAEYDSNSKDVCRYVGNATSIVERSNGYDLQASSLSSSSFSSKLITKEAPAIVNTDRPLQINFTMHNATMSMHRGDGFMQITLKTKFLTLEALRQLKDIFSRTDQSYQVLIISGMRGCFCLGLDLEPLVGPNKNKSSTELAVAIKEMIEDLSRMRKPVVAAVDGIASGLGVTLLNYMDVTIASARSTFCMPYSELGYIPEGGATLTLPQAVGSTVAMDLILRGRTLTAHEALNIGLINEVMDPTSINHHLQSRLSILTKTSVSANETAKSLMRMRLLLELPQVLENEVKLLPRMWLSVSCQESMKNALRAGFPSAQRRH